MSVQAKKLFSSRRYLKYYWLDRVHMQRSQRHVLEDVINNINI